MQCARRSQQLCPVTYRSDGFAGLCEVLDDVDNTRIQADVLRRAPSRYHQRVVILCLYVVEAVVQGEVVPGFLAVGLVALKVVHRGAHFVARLFARADCVHLMSHHQKRLKWHHHLIIFHEVANEHEDTLCRHCQHPPSRVLLSYYSAILHVGGA